MTPAITANTALFLDIDGTLLDLARTPDRVKVPRDLLRALEKLSDHLSGALAFVSGRSLESIDRLFAPFRPAAIGTHGGELRGADERSRAASRYRKKSLRFSPAWRKTFRDCCWKIRDPRWRCTIVWRRSPPVLLSAMEKHARLFESEKVHILHGKAVIEARP
jgi:trehalose-phosphatase